MTKDQATRCCDELNALSCDYAADIAPPSQSGRGKLSVLVRHVPSGNEIAWADTVDEFRYILRGIKRRIGVPV